MFTINLEKRLVSKKNKNIEEQLVINEAESILAENTEADIEILKSMGLDHAIQKSESIKRTYHGLDQSRIFSEKEIQSICLAYKLRFLDIGTYKGNIDPKLPSKIKEFETIYKTAGNRYVNLQYCKIVAPMESFVLKDRPVDPLLFYPIGNGFFYLIHKWGNDISAIRLLSGLKNRNYWTWYFSSLLMYWTPAALLTLFVFNAHPAVYLAFFAGSIVHFLFARFCDYKDTRYTYLESLVSKSVWNSNYKN